MLIPTDVFFRGGTTKPRNDVVMSAFRRIGLSERQGYGGYQIFLTVSNIRLRSPQIETSLEKTVLTIWLVDLPGSYPELGNAEKDVLSKDDIESMLSDRYSEYRIKKSWIGTTLSSSSFMLLKSSSPVRQALLQSSH